MTVRFAAALEYGGQHAPPCRSREDGPTPPPGPPKQVSDKFSTYRQLVPLLSQEGLTFLNAASAPPSNLVVHEAILRYASEALYDAHPQTTWFARARSARRLLARCIGIADDPESVVFTRDTTEGLGAFMRGLRLAPGDNVVILDNEYPSQTYGWLALSRDIGLEVRRVPTTVVAGRATAATFAPFVDARTRAVGLSSVMFDTGQRNDVAGVCAALRPRGVHVLVDLAQHVGFAAVDVRAMGGVSAAAFTLHKGLNCPTGIAALYVDPAVVAELDPTPPIVGAGAVRGGDHLVPDDGPVVFHPDARRFQRQNLSLIGAGAAEAFLRFYLDTMGPRDVEEHLYSLGDVLIAECDRLGITVVSPRDREERAPHLYVLNLRDPRWAARLESNGVRMTPNRLGIRVSFGFYSNIDDVMSLVRELESGIKDGLPLNL
ncbi:pyridoxal phosphate-dependent transferase [Biscogniauxia mediterranea]|nr:pyridoxal phosphate-dependent transferase [Biscogniauxia mediterranea]